MSVHRCLLVPELLRLICEALIDGPASLGSLAALAATSRAFQQPALDSIWSNMVDIVPLIKCMPPDLWEDRNDTSERRLLIFRRPLIASDLKRFLVHCTRVKKLGFIPRESRNRGTKIYIDPSVFEAIMLATNSRKLLPNLQELSWDSESDIFPYILLFLGPKITRLEISLDGCTGIRVSLIPSLVNLYPEITHVELSMWDKWEDLHLDAVSDAVCQWNNLRVLSVEDLNDKALLHIASLPYLRDLKFNWLNPDASPRAYDASPSSKREVGFPSLKKLVITTPGIKNCVGLIELMSSCPLCRLELYLESRSPVAHWKMLFEAMEKHCRPTTLKYISVIDRKFNRNVVGDYIIRFDHFKSLLHFPNVVQIILRPFQGFSLTADAVRAMAMGWRRIRRLTLGTRTPSCGTPGITIDDLVAFAKYCPNLFNLGIVFDARSAKTTYTKPGGGHFNANLRRLYVGDSPLTDSALVAAFLSDIFPNLTVITTRCGERERDDGLNLEMNTKWADAERMVALFMSVRIQEHRHSVNEDSDDACESSMYSTVDDVSAIAD